MDQPINPVLPNKTVINIKLKFSVTKKVWS